MKTIPGILLFQLLICTVFDVSAQIPLKFRDSTITGPQTFAIVVGISKYKYIRPLNFADKDAELFGDYLKSPGGGNMPDDNIFLLLNEKVNNANFWSKGFQWLKAKKLQKGDRLFIYLAGHGDAIDEDQFFFLGYDCNPGGDKNNYLVGGAIQLFNLKKKIAEQTAKGVEVFFIMDACRSDELPGGLPGLNFLNTAITEKNAGEIIMLATGAGQESLEDPSIGNGHGLFTYYLIDGLAGMADSIGTPDYKISFREIQNYVTQKVPVVAQARFNQKQEPYFCCDKSNNKIISNVDTAYLNNWLKRKKSENRGPGNSYNSFSTNLKSSNNNNADTTIAQMYELFNKAVRDNKLTGRFSAEYYFEQMNKQSSGSPFTLDALSTLEVEYINNAQNRVNQYLDCGMFSKKQKQENFEAALKLEKAIKLIKNDEPDFANSLMGRMYFLKASGDYNNNNISDAFQYAFTAFSLDPDAAYINNRLATLHLENGNADSALHYARKAVSYAPKWKCAYTTLSLTYKTLGLPDSASKYKQRSEAADPSKPIDVTNKISTNRKVQFGINIGGGLSKFNMTLSNWERGQVNYNDSLRSLTTNGKGRIEIGIICQVALSNKLSWRPSAMLSFENRNLVYVKTNPTGGIPVETINIKTSTLNMNLPFVFRFSENKIAPYVSAGPVFSFLLNQNGSFNKVPVKSFDMLGAAGIGVDINFIKARIVLSPEINFSAGFANIIENKNNLYTNTISELKRQGINFNVSLRRK